MVRPGTLTRAGPTTWVSGPSRELALAVVNCVEVLTSSTKPASVGAALALARMAVEKRTKDCAPAAATAETGRVVAGPAGLGSPPGVVPPVALVDTMVSEEFNCRLSTRK